MLYKILFLILINIINVNCGKCPPNEVLYPCLCNETHIQCGDIHEIDLKKIFKSISDNLGNDYESKKFKVFALNNTQMTELPENVFNDIKFSVLIFNDTINLRRFDRNAFKSIADSVEELWQDNSSRLGYSPDNQPQQALRELFDSISSLTNLRKIGFDENMITEIPENAFGRQKNLTEIYFPHFLATNGSITRIGNNAFYYLNNLTRIYIENNKLNFISANAFDFDLTSDKQLLIQLNNNLLNEKSFELGLFKETKRPIYVILTNNKISYLDEKVFEPILKLNAKNVFNFMGNPFVCDCRMFWLFKLKNDIQQQIMPFKCLNNGKYFWELNTETFKDC